MFKRILITCTLGLSAVFTFTFADSWQTITLDDGTYYHIFWMTTEEPHYFDTQERDIALLDDYEERMDAYYDLCDDLYWSTPSQCDSDPGNVTTFVTSFLGSSSPANEYWYSGGPASYRELFQFALISAASHFQMHGNSSEATEDFLFNAFALCVNGDGASIEAPTSVSVTNEAYCVTVAAEVAEGMDNDFDVPQGWAPSYYTPSIPLNFGSWGDVFFEDLTDFLQCDLFIAKWNDLQCELVY